MLTDLRFLDRITRLERRRRILAEQRFAPMAALFTDHFPGSPTVPGSFLLETLIQAASSLVEVSEEYRRKTLPALVDGARFRRRVAPEQLLAVEGLALDWDDAAVRVETTGRVDGVVAVRAEVTLALVPFESVFRTPELREEARRHFAALLSGAALSGFERAAEAAS